MVSCDQRYRHCIVRYTNMNCFSPPKILLTSLDLFLIRQSIELFSYRRNEASEIPLERLSRARMAISSHRRATRIQREKTFIRNMFNPHSGCWIVGLWQDTACEPNIKRCIAGLKIGFDQAPVLEAQRGTRQIILETAQLSASGIIQRGP